MLRFLHAKPIPAGSATPPPTDTVYPTIGPNTSALNIQRFAFSVSPSPLRLRQPDACILNDDAFGLEEDADGLFEGFFAHLEGGADFLGGAAVVQGQPAAMPSSSKA